jgi:hypothetical protein
VSLFVPVQVELNQLDRHMRRVAEANRLADPKVAANLDRWSTRFPWMDPDAMVSLALGGMDADSGMAESIARSSLSAGGMSGRAVGQPVSARQAAREAPDTDDGWLGSLADAGRAISRGFFTVLSGMYQEVVGQFREGFGDEQAGEASLSTPGFVYNLPQAGEWQSQSDLGIAIGNVFEGEDVDMGTGWFPAGEIEAERRRRELSYGTIGGEAFTIGRYAADRVVEPGTRPFTVLSGLTDFSAALTLDPVNYAGGAVASGIRNRRLLTEAGGLFGVRRTVSPESVEQWLRGADGQRVVQRLSEMDRTYDIWNALGRTDDTRLAYELARASDPDDVMALLGPKLGVQVREKPVVMSDWRLNISRRAAQPRFRNIIPRPTVDLDSPRDAVNQTERFLRNVKAPQTTIDNYVDRMAGATHRFERFAILKDVMSDTADDLVERFGADPQKARSLTRMFDRKGPNEYFTDEVGLPSSWRQLVVGDEAFDLPRPHLLVEHINRVAPLPDHRELRRVATRHRAILRGAPGGKGVDRGIALSESTVAHFQNMIWKPAVLLRFAWPLRVLAEEQLRIAAGGLHSLVNHPVSAIAWVTGKKGQAGLLDEGLESAFEHQAAMFRGAPTGLFDPENVVIPGYDRFYKAADDTADYVRGWSWELAELRADPVARMVAQQDNLDDAKDLFWASHQRRILQDAGEDWLSSRAAADTYIETIADRIRIKTGDDLDIVEYLRTGKFGDEVGPNLDQDTLVDVVHEFERNPNLRKWLEGKMDAGPSVVKGQRTTTLQRYRIAWDHATNVAFSYLMSKPANKLSRSPVFRQNYWQRVDELMPFADEATQAKILSRAEKAKVKVTKPSTSGDLSMADVDVVAKGHALDSVKSLLFDLSDRGQFFDVYRTVFPFGEAFREVLTSWGKLVRRNPVRIGRRFQQAHDVTQDEDLGALLGSPVGEGFVYTNQYGDEVFTYPGSGWLTDKMLGVPVPLTGRVQGLNLVGQMLPGIGPVAQIPIAWALPDKPAYDKVRDLIMPYGEPDGLASMLPAWVRQLPGPLVGSDDPDRVRRDLAATMDVATYLASTGDYDTDTPEGVQQLLHDAKNKALAFQVIRAAAAFSAPASPTPEWQVEDKDGNLMALFWLRNEYRAMQEEDPTTASIRFLTQFGTDVFLAMQNKTHVVSFGYPVTTDGEDWMREHEGLDELYPNVVGYFAPTTGEFSYAAYSRSISAGARQPLTADQFVKLGNARVAALRYDYERERVNAATNNSPGDRGRAYLRAVRERLIEEYPGYGEMIDGGLGLGERARLPQVIRELEAAALDPQLADTETAVALRGYLSARERVLQASAERGFVTLGADANADLRDWLWRYGERVADQFPDFQPVWESVLSREVEPEES